MKSFNVIWWDFNKKEPEPYDIIPYLVDCYENKTKRPKTFEEFKKFIEHESAYMWWSRCEYEILIQKWPPFKEDESKKWDIHMQVMMNIDIIAQILMEEVYGNKAKKNCI